MLLCICYYSFHGDVIKWKHFPRYWPFVLVIHLSPVNSPHKGRWRGALMLSLICAWLNFGWAGDLRRHCAHYDVTVMLRRTFSLLKLTLIQYSAWIHFNGIGTCRHPCLERNAILMCFADACRSFALGINTPHHSNALTWFTFDSSTINNALVWNATFPYQTTVKYSREI